MRQQSDAVQHTAQAYAEREVLEACCRTLGGSRHPGVPPGQGTSGRPLSPGLRALLEPVVLLYALHRVEQVWRRGWGGARGEGLPVYLPATGLMPPDLPACQRR